MTPLVLIVTVILGVLSLVQRVVPWLIYSRVKTGEIFRRIFDLVAVSAFASLMVENIQSFTPKYVVPLIPAIFVAYRTRNLGATVLVALVSSLILSFLVPY